MKKHEIAIVFIPIIALAIAFVDFNYSLTTGLWLSDVAIGVGVLFTFLGAFFYLLKKRGEKEE